MVEKRRSFVCGNMKSPFLLRQLVDSNAFCLPFLGSSHFVVLKIFRLS